MGAPAERRVHFRYTHKESTSLQAGKVKVLTSKVIFHELVKFSHNDDSDVIKTRRRIMNCSRRKVLGDITAMDYLQSTVFPLCSDISRFITFVRLLGSKLFRQCLRKMRN